MPVLFWLRGCQALVLRTAGPLCRGHWDRKHRAEPRGAMGRVRGFGTCRDVSGSGLPEPVT